VKSASPHRPTRRALLTLFASHVLLVGCRSKQEGPAAEEAIGPSYPPAKLAARIADVERGDVVVFYVGPEALFAKGRVPGAKKLGEAGTAAGKSAIAETLAKIPPATEIVLYCGCCPVKSCPNVRPASAVLRSLGRQNAYVLDLPTRFATDWADKGYPVERG
jgi:hypothetical protein